MKTIALFLAVSISIVAVSCKSDDDAGTPISSVNVDFTFTHNWDGNNIENPDFETTEYTNAHGTNLTLSKLVYIVSDVTFTSATGEVYEAGDYNLVNVRQESDLTFTPNIEIPKGDYTISFTFGLDDEDNVNGEHPDLNTTVEGNWGVPLPLGGGYHYMRMEGKFDDGSPTPANYAYHAIRAIDTNTSNTTDTSFQIDLGTVTISDNTDVEVKMNVAEWFKNPNEWDLSVLNSALMMNYDAQLMMSQNGATAFSKGSVTQN